MVLVKLNTLFTALLTDSRIPAIETVPPVPEKARVMAPAVLLTVRLDPAAISSSLVVATLSDARVRVAAAGAWKLAVVLLVKMMRRTVWAGILVTVLTIPL